MIEMLTIISWREPLWLFMALLPLLIGLMRRLLRHKVQSFAEPALMPWVAVCERHQFLGMLFSKNSAYLLAWLLIALAAAGPRLPLPNPSLASATNMDIMLLVDVSASMHATDIKPSRLRRAQIEIEELLERNKGKRIGIIVYAARPHLYVPLTWDTQAIRYYLQFLDDLILPTAGSDMKAALSLSVQELERSKQSPSRDATTSSAMVLISDGDTSGNMAVPDLHGTPLFVLGIGTTEGSAIPQQGGGWLEADDRPVISRLNRSFLQALAQDHGGKFAQVQDDDSDWHTLYDEGLNDYAQRQALDADTKNLQWRELYTWPLALAAIFLFFALTPFKIGLKAQASHTVAMLLPAVWLFTLLAQSPAFAAPEADIQANAFAHFSQGNYAQALAEYRQIAGYDGRFGEAASLYRLADYHGAISQFSQAALAANSDEQRAMALHNLGNSYFQLGDYANAAIIYRDSLRYRPDATSTSHNLDFTLSLQQAVIERVQRIRRRDWLESTGRIAEATESQLTRQDTIISSGKSTAQLPEGSPFTGLDEIKDSTLEELINKGIEHIQLAAENTRFNGIQQKGPTKLELVSAYQAMGELADAQPSLWKQIFEKEEGFPAPLQQPRQLPGVAPW